MKKRFWACFLSLNLLLTMMPTMAFAADDEVNEPEGTVEVCVETEGYTLEAGHEGECVVVESEAEEPKDVPCTVTEGCTLEAGHEGECITNPVELVCSELEGCSDTAHVEECPLYKEPIQTNDLPEQEESTAQTLIEDSNDLKFADSTASNGAAQKLEGAEGSNLTWALDDDGILTISGTGAMKDYGYDDSSRPWYDQKTSITKIQIDNQVTSVGAWAFHGCTNVTEVTLPESIEKIGASAFQGLSKLTGSFLIGKNVNYLGQDAFYATSISAYDVAEGNVSYIEKEDILYSADGKTIISCPQKKSGAFQSSWLDGVESIADSAFRNCKQLTGSVTIPQSVTSIGTLAFQNCEELTGNLIIPDSVIGEIKEYTFSNCGFNGQLQIGSGITEVGRYAFHNCKFTSLDLGNIVTIGDEAFSDCSAVTALTIPGSVKTIGKRAFHECTSMTGALNIPDSVTGEIGEGTFYKCKFTSIEIGDGITAIGKQAFYEITSENPISLTLGNNITTIGESAFYGSSIGEDLVIPDSVTEIQKMAFYNCQDLTGDLTLSKNLITLGEYAFFNCKFTGPIIIPNGIIEIPQYTFYFHISATPVCFVVPSSVAEFANYSLDDRNGSRIIYLDNTTQEEALKSVNLGNGSSPRAITKGGIFLEGTSFESGKLAQPVNNGGIFKGWYDNESCTGEPVTNTETGKTYYARWDNSDYTVSEKLNFGEVVYGSTASQVIEVSGSDGAGTLKVADNDIFDTAVNEEDHTITVTPRSDLSVGEYKEMLYVTTPDGATFFVPVTLEVVRAGSELAIWANGSENLTLSGGGDVTLRITGDVNANEVTIACNGENIEIPANEDGTYTVTLPNETAKYTFTATYDGDQNHEMARATCTVSVTRHTGGGGASHPEVSDDSSSDRNDRDDDDTENIDEEDVPLTEGKVADFDDVPADAWFAEAVQYVYEHDLMTGVSENLFAPNAQMNRAMVAQILFNMEQPTDTEAPAAFRDVAADQWYAKAVNWAVWQGYMSGYGAGSFGPNDALTREQLVTVLWRYSGSPVMGDSSMLNTFSDAALTSDYAQQAMIWAYAQGVISGNADGTLNPQGTATRAEIAQMLMNYCENVK